jgi:deoxyribodipyrimidine photo-lyase
VKLGFELASPIVDLATATRESKAKLHALRKTSEVRKGKEAVVEKHASRKTPQHRATKAKSKKTNLDQQLGFNF